MHAGRLYCWYALTASLARESVCQVLVEILWFDERDITPPLRMLTVEVRDREQE
jgi:hypothetical protein